MTTAYARKYEWRDRKRGRQTKEQPKFCSFTSYCVRVRILASTQYILYSQYMCVCIHCICSTQRDWKTGKRYKNTHHKWNKKQIYVYSEKTNQIQRNPHSRSNTSDFKVLYFIRIFSHFESFSLSLPIPTNCFTFWSIVFDVIVLCKQTQTERHILYYPMMIIIASIESKHIASSSVRCVSPDLE